MKTHFDENHVIHFQATVHDSFQDIFDYVAEKLMEQGEKSISWEQEVCQYRQEHSDKMLKCAIGWLIPDELYNPGFEDHGGGLEYVLNTLGVTTRDVDDDTYFTERYLFFRELQECHDNTPEDEFRTGLWNEMSKLANKFNLDKTHLNKVYWYGKMNEQSY